MNSLDEIKSEEHKQRIIKRSGPDLISDGIVCPHCGTYESYKDKSDPSDTDK
jgi:hypothetical protein